MGVPADTCFHVLDRQTPVYSCVHKMGVLSVPHLQSCITQFPCSNVHLSYWYGRRGQNAKCSADASGLKLHMQRMYSLGAEEQMIAYI